MPSNPSNNGKKSCHVCVVPFIPKQLLLIKKCPSGSNAANPLTSNNSGPLVPQISGLMYATFPRAFPVSDSPPPGPLAEQVQAADATLESSTILGATSSSSSSILYDGKGTLTLSRHADLQAAWDHASLKLTPYKGEQRSFDDLLPLVGLGHQSHLGTPVCLQFHWDAEKIFQHSGQSFTRIFHEPWTSDAFWDAQIPDGGHVLALILYADKTKLSSFGTAKGYPVVAHCVNLLTEIWNGDGFGGGHIIGWLPVVTEDPKESGKPEFINFKCVVWHTSFKKVIQSITMHSKSGCWLECGDGIQQPFPSCPHALCDYEEQTAADTQTVIKDAHKLQSAAEHEKLLLHLSLHDVDNVFWNLSYSDLHLHSHLTSFIQTTAACLVIISGKQFKILITGYGHSQEEQVDKQFDDVPRWSGLNHFQGVMKVSFTDGSKYEDISKHTISSHCMTRSQKAGSCFSVYLYLAFEAHTEHTITSGQRELESFAQCMKPWRIQEKLAFPKNACSAKGSDCSYNMKPNEKLHGPLMNTYKMHTNFKDVGPQILKLEHLKFIFSSICSQLNNWSALKMKTKMWTNNQQMFTVMEESLCTSLASWLTKELPAYDLLPYIPDKISYESKVDFQQYANLVYCNPSFHGYFDKAGDYLVMDVVDHTRDLFLHCTTPPFSAQQENIISNYNGKDVLVEEEQMDEWFCTSYE
ncbi:hypothetical protein BJV74DRAFT_799983 [Russula compacta]|nr:hypothetical protein BJV74DRAFT_799983 [Russula compacta]